MKIRAEGTGFHARLWPAPPLPWGRFVGVGVGFGAVGAAAAVGLGSDPGAQAAVGLAVPAFGLLLAVVAWLPGLAPVEIEVTDDQIYWHGERYRWDRIGGARATGGTLELLATDGHRLDAVAHLRPEVATWLARAIDASRADVGSPPPSRSSTT